jgi:tetratricopeptide (TPR) repeat protein
MSLCSKCGAETADGANFCANCGTETGADPAEAARADGSGPAKFCAHCGVKIGTGVKVYAPEQPKIRKPMPKWAPKAAAGAIALAAVVVISVSIFKGMAYQKHYKTGNERYAAGNLDGAIEAYSEAIRLRPKKVTEARYMRGKAYFDTENYSGAFADFELAPRNADACYMRGKTYFYAGEADTAMRFFDQAIQLNPDHGLAHAWRGLAYFIAKNDIGLSEADFDRARALGVTEDDAYFLRKAGRNPSDKPEIDILDLVAIMTDSVVTFGARGGFLPSLYYREFHGYETKDGASITVPRGEQPVHPVTGRRLTVQERRNVFLYVVEPPDRGAKTEIIKVLYTLSGEMVTDTDGNAVESMRRSIQAGDTVFALANPRRIIIVTDPLAQFYSKPLSVYDEALNRLMKLKDRYGDAIDADDIIIAAEDEVIELKIARLAKIARQAGYANVSRARLRN